MIGRLAFLISFVLVSSSFCEVFTLANAVATVGNTRQNGKPVGTGLKKAVLHLDQPRGGWTVDRMLEVSGSISDTTIDPVTININGDRYLLRTIGGKFKRKFPVIQGKNTIVVMGTNKGGRAQEVRTVFAQVPPLSIMAVLTSDTDGVYTDLHIYEPSADGDPNADPKIHIFWADTKSASGGKFYLNEQGGDFDQPGYGPYLYTHSSPPMGIYRIDANYWPSGDKAHTLGNLNLVLFGGTPNETKRQVQQPLVMPGETVTLAFLKILKGGVGSIYVPGIDAKPTDKTLWPQWVIDAPVRRKEKSEQGSD